MCECDYTEWITRSFVNKAKEGGYVKINVREKMGNPDKSGNIEYTRRRKEKKINNITVFQSKYTTVIVLLDISESK
jgi:hypothetical protein